jgi:S-(hydroxymethyl)glutathione dehydrogenase / alcohol dehydrogenase
MQIRAAVLWEQRAPLSVEEIELDPPGPGEVLVEVRAAGVCHSDLHPACGDWPTRTPLVLGHEGAGIVREVGPGVTRAGVGDHVVFCWAPACGACPPCQAGRPVLCDRLDRTTYRNRLPAGDTRLRARGQAVGAFLSTACFADHTVVAEEGIVPVPHDVGFDVLAAVGCAVITGVGAVLNAARVPEGAVIAVIGVGGVGLNVVQGAALARCARIVAVDRSSHALQFAAAFGATDCVEATAETAQAIRAVAGGRGVDYAFDTVGTPATLDIALNAVRKGGTVVLTGLSRIDAQASVAMYPLVMQERRLIGSLYGSGQPARDIPRLVEMHRQGRLKLGELVARRYPLEGINDALAALAGNAGARGIVMP